MAERKSSVWNGKRIASLKAGCLLGPAKAAELISCLNALLFWKVNMVDGPTGKVVLDDRGAMIEMPKGGGPGGGSGQILCQITRLFSDATHACDYFAVKRRSATDVVGDEFKVAKVIAARMAASYAAGGESYTYDYTAGGTDGYDNNRVSTKASDSSTEAQRVYQIYYVDQLVMVVPTSLSFVAPAGDSDLKWIEDASDRGWTAP